MCYGAGARLEAPVFVPMVIGDVNEVLPVGGAKGKQASGLLATSGGLLGFRMDLHRRRCRAHDHALAPRHLAVEGSDEERRERGRTWLCACRPTPIRRLDRVSHAKAASMPYPTWRGFPRLVLPHLNASLSTWSRSGFKIRVWD